MSYQPNQIGNKWSPPPAQPPASKSQPSESEKKTQNVSEMLMEVEDLLQRKFHNGDISKSQFTQLSQELDFIQGQYEKNQGNEHDAKEKALKSLSQLESEIHTLAGEGKGGATTSEGGPTTIT